MPAYPKLSKKRRLANQAEQRQQLAVYRRVHTALAVQRDLNLCVVCYFKLNCRKRADDVHHVYGRGRKVGDWRESYKNRLCVCRNHHPPAIQIPRANDDLVWVEEVLALANAQPINPNFKYIVGVEK